MWKVIFLIILIITLGCQRYSVENDAQNRLSYILEKEWVQNNEGKLVTENIKVVYHHPSDSLVVISFVGYMDNNPLNKETLRYIYYIQKDGPYEAITQKEIEDRSQWDRLTQSSASSKDAKDNFIDSSIRSVASLIIADRGRKVE
ncbi:MAG: hypothetical protein K2G85_05980 [Muribaculaceae bacterium]|nr:hypothetical protein [Muribaculaceae bacterium]